MLSAIQINLEHAATVDLAEPLIAAPIPGADYFPIDGWHRIRRALTENITRLPVVLLTETEEYECRVHGGGKLGGWYR